MPTLVTPESATSSLPDFPFSPHFVGVDHGIRMCSVDEGPEGAPTIVLLHGQPSWSFLYRKMIPPIVRAGFRVLAPDLVGFGRSDKPPDRASYSYAAHMRWLTAWFDQVCRSPVVIFCQDWGGLLGLRLVAFHPERFLGVCAANTFLPVGGTYKPTDVWLKFRDFVKDTPRLPIARLIQAGCLSKLDASVRAGYDAPFPSEEHKAGARAFPSLVPVEEGDPEGEINGVAWEALARFEKPFLTLFSDSDPITRGGDVYMRRNIPGTKGQPHETISGAGHFLQEDKGEEVAERLVAWAVSHWKPRGS